MLLAFAGIFVAAIGVFFWGLYALMFAIMLLGVSVVALASELDSRDPAASDDPTQADDDAHQP